MKTFIMIFVYLFSLNSFSQSADEMFIKEVISGLRNFEALHDSVKDIHPVLHDLQPVAIVKGDELFIFDADSVESAYSFIKKIPAPFPMNEGIRASFPLMEYDNRPVCVTGKDALNTTGGQAIILHEFVHCSQYNTIEPELKNNLELYKASMEKNNYSWEITHPFAFDSLFMETYREFHLALKSGDLSSAGNYRNNIRKMLSNTDFEYLVWQEWKEGFARYLENQIRKEAGAKENTGGSDYPEDRVVFYYGGSTFINYLIDNNIELKTNLKFLFNRMLKFPKED